MTTGLLNVRAPLSGTVASLASVPHPAFAMGGFGAGIAVVPDPGVEIVELRAPFNGCVTRCLPNLYQFGEVWDPLEREVMGISPGSASDKSVLIQVGIDTGHLQGYGYSPHVVEGDEVMLNNPLVTYAPKELGRMGFDPIVAIVATKVGEENLTFLKQPGEPVEMGEILFRF